MSLSARRISFALVLGSSFLASAASAQTVVTGTDPCPPKLFCSAGQTASPSTATTTTKTTSTTSTASTPSTTSTTLQTLMVLFGIA